MPIEPRALSAPPIRVYICNEVAKIGWRGEEGKGELSFSLLCATRHLATQVKSRLQQRLRIQE